MRNGFRIVIALLVVAGAALAQTSEHAEVADEKKWELSLSVMTYFVPNDREYVQPTITADRGWLHLEARYNYEDINTGSVWAGCNFSFGEEITLDLTPMIGVIFGNTRGVAPGYEATLAWRMFELYTEGEYVFDLEDASSSYFYTWTELTVSPLDWLRCGLVIQRTKAYDTDFDIQHGLLIGVQHENLGLTGYLLNPEDDPVVAIGLAMDF